MKRIGAGLAALALVSVTSLSCLVPGVAAMPGDDCSDKDSDTYAGYEQCRLLSHSKLPAGFKMVAEHWEEGVDFSNLDESLIGEVVLGKDNAAIYEKLEEIEDGEEYEDLSQSEKMELYAELFDKFSYFTFGDSDSAVALHLEDEDNSEKPYSGDGITIKYNFDFNPFDGEGISEVLKMSSKEWRAVVVHISKIGNGDKIEDYSVELLPATVDDDGVWEFTTTSFSAFWAAIAPVEEEAPKTVDNVAAYVGVAVAGALSLFGAIYCSKIASKR